jgi:hypothetical protein
MPAIVPPTNTPSLHSADIGVTVQGFDADLQALADLATTGVVVRTGAGTVASRTITGTTNQVLVADGNGVGGNPTLSTPQDIHTGAEPTFAGIITTAGVTRKTKVIGAADSPYSVLDADHKYLIDTSAGAVTMLLPTAGSELEKWFKHVGGASAITITPFAAETIDKVAASITMPVAGQALILQSDGAGDWNIW